MKKIVFILLSVVLTSGAFAQTAPQKAKTAEKKKELKSDIKEKREDEKVVRKDLTKGHVGKAHKDHQEVKSDKAEANKDAIALKRHGVAHPKTKVKKEIHEENEAKEKAETK